MPTFRVYKTNNYTVMSNYHLQDINLTLKSKGLLSQMLSLLSDWDYSIKGLAAINKYGIDAIKTALKEFEKNNYLICKKVRDKRGRIIDTEYCIYELPLTKNDEDKSEDESQKPRVENLQMAENPLEVENPHTDKPHTDN